MAEGSDDFAGACVCVEFRFYLIAYVCACASACVARENQALEIDQALSGDFVTPVHAFI